METLRKIGVLLTILVMTLSTGWIDVIYAEGYINESNPTELEKPSMEIKYKEEVESEKETEGDIESNSELNAESALMQMMVSNDNKPTLTASQELNHAKLEWAVEMLDEDIIFKTSLEDGDSIPQMRIETTEGKEATQKITDEDSFSGSKSLKLNNTFGKGNTHPDVMKTDSAQARWHTYVDGNRASYDYTLKKGDHLSVSYRVKTNDVLNVNFFGNWTRSKEIVELKDLHYNISDSIYVTQSASKGDTEIFVDNLDGVFGRDSEGFRSLHPTYVSFEENGLIDNNFAETTVPSENKINLRNPLLVDVNVGTPLGSTMVFPYNFNDINLETTNGEWMLINQNTFVGGDANVDWGAMDNLLRSVITSKGETFIDDVMLGFATNTELYRNNEKIYEGKLSSFDDKQAVDNVAPDAVTDYVVNEKGNSKYVKPIQPKDNGTQYSYQVKAISNDGSGEYWSDEQVVNVVSGVEGYSFKISDKVNDIPSGIINSKDDTIEIPNSVSEDNYVHIQAVDEEGNRSDVKTISLEAIEKALPKVTTLGYPETWVRNAITVRILIESEYGLQRITLPDGSIKDTTAEKIDYTFKNNGEHLFIFEDSKGNKLNYVFNVDKIDIVSPEIDIKQFDLGWTNEDANLRIEANDGKSGVRGIRLLTDTENKNILSLNNVSDSDIVYGDGNIDKDGYGDGDRYFHKKDGVVTFDQGRSHFSGISMPYLREFEEEESYTMSFHATKLSGIVDVIGGHLKFSEETRVYIDGVEMKEIIRETEPNTWSGGVSYPDDTEKHFIEVQFKAGDSGESLDKSINIQPNRYTGLKDYKMKIENLQIEKGLRATEYVLNNIDSPVMENPLDYVIQDNGVYVFEATDNAGNASNGSIEVTNIDKVAPKINIKQNISENTHKNVILTVEATDDLSGIKSIIHDGEVNLNNGKFEVTKNGRYTFIAEDNAGNITEESIDINNIVRELKFEAPHIKDIVSVELQGSMNVEVPIGNIKITDWRDESNDWKLLLQASQLNNGSHVLPEGSLEIAGVNNVSKLDGNKSGKLSILRNYTIIDDGIIEVIDANNERGVYDVQFKNNALKFNLSSGTLKKGVYNTKLTWILESTPEIR